MASFGVLSSLVELNSVSMWLVNSSSSMTSSGSSLIPKATYAFDSKCVNLIAVLTPTLFRAGCGIMSITWLPLIGLLMDERRMFFMLDSLLMILTNSVVSLLPLFGRSILVTNIINRKKAKLWNKFGQVVNNVRLCESHLLCVQVLVCAKKQLKPK